MVHIRIICQLLRFLLQIPFLCARIGRISCLTLMLKHKFFQSHLHNFSVHKLVSIMATRRAPFLREALLANDRLTNLALENGGYRHAFASEAGAYCLELVLTFG